MTYTIAVCTVKPPDDGQRKCPKHVGFYSKNKFEKLVHLVGFIIRIYHDARSPERQKWYGVRCRTVIRIYILFCFIERKGTSNCKLGKFFFSFYSLPGYALRSSDI